MSRHLVLPEYMELDNDHTVGGTPNRFEKRKIHFDNNWKKSVANKPLFNYLGVILNKLS